MNNFLIIAALEFLRRGIVSPRADAENFAAWCKAKGGINYPERVLQSWNTRADSTVSPADGSLIADFAEAIRCENLDAICAISKVEVTSGGILSVHVSSNEFVNMLDECVCSNTQPLLEYLRTVGASAVEYHIPRAEPQRKPNATAKILADIFDNEPMTEAAICSRKEAQAFISGISEKDKRAILDDVDAFRQRKRAEYEKRARASIKSLPDGGKAYNWQPVVDAIEKKVTQEADERYSRLVAEYKKTPQPCKV